MLSLKSIALSNGMRIIHVPHLTGSVTACLRGLAGSCYEGEDEVGAAHALEHLCTKTNGLSNEILANGGRMTGTTSRDDVAFLVKVLKKDLPLAIEHLFAIFTKPKLDPAVFENVKGSIRHEIYQNIEDPKKHIGRLAYKILYPNQRLATFNTGTVEDLNSLALENLVKFYQRHYLPGNFVLSVCGNFNSRQFFKLANEYFGKLAGKDPNQIPIHKPNYKPGVIIENRPNLSQTHLKIDYHGYNTAQKLKYPAHLLAIILSKRLNQMLKEANVPSLSPYILDTASFSTNSYGLFGTYTSLSPESLEDFLTVYALKTNILKTELITQEELHYAKNKAQADIEFAMEKTSLRADLYSELYLYQNTARDHEEEIIHLRSCTKNDVLDTARDLFSQDPKLTVIDRSLSEPALKQLYTRAFLR